MLTKKCRYSLHEAVHMWCLALRSISGKACDVPGSREGLFSCFFLGGVGAYLPPFVLRITDSASDGARSWRSRVSSAEDVDKLWLDHLEGLPVSEVCNILDFFVTETTGKSCKTTRSNPKLPIFLPNKQASTLPPLKRTSFVWNKMPVIGDGPLILMKMCENKRGEWCAIKKCVRKTGMCCAVKKHVRICSSRNTAMTLPPATHTQHISSRTLREKLWPLCSCCILYWCVLSKIQMFCDWWHVAILSCKKFLIICAFFFSPLKTFIRSAHCSPSRTVCHPP